MTPQRNEWPTDELERFLAAEAEADRRPKTWVCGWGGTPRCDVRLPERGLCDEHRAIIRESLRDVPQPPPTPRPTTPKPRPESKRHYATDEERAAAARRIGEIVAEGGEATRASLARALSVSAESRLFRDAINMALEAGSIIAYGRRGYLPPGREPPTPEQLAVEIAAYVAEAQPPVRRSALAERFPDVSGHLLAKAIKCALAAGLIVSRSGSPVIAGYWPPGSAPKAA